MKDRALIDVYDVAILESLEIKNGLLRRELAKKSGISNVRIQTHLRRLKSMDIINYKQGIGRSHWYFITNKGEELLTILRNLKMIKDKTQPQKERKR